MLLFLVASISLVWMHLAIRRMERRTGSAASASIEAYDMAAQ
jgi:hypothetical protein